MIFKFEHKSNLDYNNTENKPGWLSKLSVGAVAVYRKQMLKITNLLV